MAKQDPIERTLQRLVKEWDAFHTAYAGLSDEDLRAPGVDGVWSVRDLIAHVTWWEEEALAHLPGMLAGARAPRYADTHGGLHAFNAAMADARKDQSLPDVKRRAERVHAQLIAFVRTIPADQLARETPVRRRLRWDTYGHYALHAAAIRAWRQHSSP
jgi:hypothetical protein